MTRASPAAFLSLHLGDLIGGLCLNDLQLDRAGPRRGVRKRRRWYAPALIQAGRLYVRVTRLHIRVLPRAAWQAYELELYRELYGEEARLRPDGWLEVPFLGDALALLLARPEVGAAAKLRALACAAGELHRVHQIMVGAGSTRRPFSHADAGVRNVAYCPRQNRAHWFDFEMVHAPDLPATWRHADDLRALLYSALALLPATLGPAAIRASLSAYPTPAVHAQLRERIASGTLALDTYHLAQLRLARAGHARLDQQLLAGLQPAGAPREGA